MKFRREEKTFNVFGGGKVLRIYKVLKDSEKLGYKIITTEDFIETHKYYPNKRYSRKLDLNGNVIRKDTFYSKNS